MKKVELFFKYPIDNYKPGYAYLVEGSDVEIERLLRRGCIYASKDAKYYEVEKKAIKPPVEVAEEEPVKEEIEDVDHKDSEQTKVQAKRAKKSKLKE